MNKPPAQGPEPYNAWKDCERKLVNYKEMVRDLLIENERLSQLIRELNPEFDPEADLDGS